MHPLNVCNTLGLLAFLFFLGGGGGWREELHFSWHLFSLSLKENKGRKRGDWYLKQISTDLKHGSKMDMEK